MITEISTTSFNETNEHESTDLLGNYLKRKKLCKDRQRREVKRRRNLSAAYCLLYLASSDIASGKLCQTQTYLKKLLSALCCVAHSVSENVRKL